MSRLVPLLLAAVLLLAGCGGPPDDADAPGLAAAAGGPMTFVVGKDTTSYFQPLLDRWNRAHPDEWVKMLELPEAADEQRAQMVANLQARNERFDILALDTIWTAEFAEAGWITPLDASMFPLGEFFPGAVKTAMYKGKLYAVPYSTNAGLLYYRKDILDKEGLKPPTTWAELREQASRLSREHHIGGYAGQFLPYEGLTVNYLEAVQSAGGELLNADGTTATVDAAAQKALDFMVTGLREGWIPQEALSYKEEESRLAFQQGRLLFARNWPYAYGPAEDSPMKGKFAVAPMPGADGPAISTLGGYNLAVNSSSKRQKSALEFIRYFTGPDIQRLVLTEGSFAPVWSRFYDDPALIKDFPYLPVLKDTILRARPRPVNANYNQISLVIAGNVSDALAFRRSVPETMTRLRQQLAQTVRTP
ncbi:ABC transporter substrate-binding protein [Thermopolyspora sp. NPDC052614]|uniref:ABC transporter substrate-binding protein n=1 Tax=Thermopolyspora sp. NPDC052614 TaxID=3155682 RepID=UPI00343A6D1E